MPFQLSILSRVATFLVLMLMFPTSVFALGRVSSAPVLHLYDSASPITTLSFGSLNISTRHAPSERLAINVTSSDLHGFIHVFIQATSSVRLGHGFNKESVDHWCGLFLIAAIAFAILVDWSVRLADWVYDAVANTKKRTRCAGLRPSVKTLAELGLGTVSVGRGAKKVVYSTNIGRVGFSSPSARERRDVLNLVLAHLRLRRAGVVHTSMDISSVFDALRRQQHFDPCPALRTHAFASTLFSTPVGSPIKLGIRVEELDATSGVTSLRAPVSAWAMTRRQHIRMSAPSSTLKAKPNSGLVSTTSTHESTYARRYPGESGVTTTTDHRPAAARMGLVAPLFFSALSFMLLSCMFAEHDADTSPSYHTPCIVETSDEDTVPTPLDLALRSSSFPSPASFRPSVRKATGVLELTLTPNYELSAEPVPVSGLAAERRKEVISLVLANQPARIGKSIYALLNMGLAYLFRRSIYLSPVLNTRMSVPTPTLTSAPLSRPPAQPDDHTQNPAPGRLAIEYHPEETSGCFGDAEFKADAMAKVEADVEQRPTAARRTQRAPKFAAYVPPALRNTPADSHTTTREAAIKSSRTSVLQKRDRDSQETQDARRGDPEARLGSSATAVDIAPEHAGAAVSTIPEIVGEGAEDGLKKKRTRRGRRTGRPKA